GHLLHELRLARQPAGFALRLRADQDDVLVLTNVAPDLHHVLGVPAALARGVQPDHQGVADVRVVVLRDLHPVLVVAGRRPALPPARLRLLLVVLLVLLLLRLLLLRLRRPCAGNGRARRRHVFARLHRLLGRVVLRQLLGGLVRQGRELGGERLGLLALLA